MGLGVNVRHNLKRLEASLGGYSRELMLAAVRAMNRTSTTVRAEGARRLASELRGLKVGVVKKQIKPTQATSGSPRAVIAFSAKRFRLLGNFVPTTARRVSAARLPWRIETLDGERVDPAVVRRAFIARSRAGTAHVWIRLGKTRYPITALLAPSAATTFADRGVGVELLAIGRARFPVVLYQEMRHRLRGR